MKYICQICGYVYDEEKEGVLFKDLPEDWACPICTAPKDMFEPEQTQTEEKVEVSSIDEDLLELSPGILSAIFSNLARGSEKQYDEKNRLLFLELANYFKERTPKEDKDLLELVTNDLNYHYPNVINKAKELNDRGSQRASLWGEKVTKMTENLLKRYQKEGPSFLDNNKVYVCTICGFIYVGNNLPQICPVCKVPNYKFEEITRRTK